MFSGLDNRQFSSMTLVPS
nr:hypothetical protein [Sicyoidochytrium minutum DNA virus]